MASIGDLIMRVVADLKGFKTQVAKEATKTGEQAGKNLSKGMSKSLGSKAKGGILQGLGLGAGLGVIGLVSTAVSTLTGVIGDSIKAFNEDQVSQQKLRSSLEANIPAWDGNTDAIEEVLAARMKLGFSDDEQRESLAKLTAATHDQNKALDLSRIAMDLARFSGTDLASASADLIKVQAGQFRSLKKLGIQLPKNANAEEALAAIQKVVTGNAEDYAETNEGKVLVSQVRINEAMEKFGEVMAGPVADGVTVAADAIEGLIPLMHDLFADLSKEDAQTEAVGFFQDLGDGIIDTVDKLTFWDDFESQADGRRRRRLKESAAAVRDNGRETLESLATVGEGFTGLGDDAEEGTDKVVLSFQNMVDSLNEDAQDLIDEFFDPIHTEEERHDSRLALFAAQEALRQSKTAAAAKAAKRDIVGSLEKQAEALQELGTQGKLTKADVDKFQKDVNTSFALMKRKVPPALQAIIDKMHQVEKFDVDISATVRSNGPARGPARKKGAAGAQMRKGEPRLVGEYRSEVFVPEVAGRLIPRVSSLSELRSGSGYTDQSVTNVNVGRLDKRTMADVRREMKMISDVKRLKKAG